jgi:hypothetical protein
MAASAPPVGKHKYGVIFNISHNSESVLLPSSSDLVLFYRRALSKWSLCYPRGVAVSLSSDYNPVLWVRDHVLQAYTLLDNK